MTDMHEDAVTGRTDDHRLGLITLDLGFEPLPRMVGHHTTLAFPVIQYRLKEQSLGQRIVEGDAGLRDAVLAAGRELAARGADAVATACGYFSIYQRDVEVATGKPVFTSPLLMLPGLLDGQADNDRVLVVWAADSGANASAIAAAGVDPADPRLDSVAMPGTGRFARSILGDETIDVEAVSAELDRVVSARTTAGDIGAVLLECGEMPAFASTLVDKPGPPIYDYVDYLRSCFAATSRPGGPDQAGREGSLAAS